MLNGLRTLAYRVEDLDAAKAWYAELLGHGPYFDQPFYVGFDVSGYELGLQPADQANPAGAGGDTALWAVDDMERTVARLTALGAAVHSAPRDVGDGIVVASFLDPFGNRLGVIVNPHFRAEVGAAIAAAGDELSERSVQVEAVVAATPDELWPLWTTGDGMAKWLVSSCRMELRVGGPYELFFLPDNPPGTRGGEGCRVLSFIRPRMLSFTWNAPPHLPTRSARTWVVVEFLDAGGGTRVRLTHTGWPAAGLDDPETGWGETFAYFETAWRSVVDKLEAYCRD